MKLFVKTLKGNHFEIDVEPSDTVAAVKKHIETIHGQDVYPCAQQLLIHQGKVLKDETTLIDNKVAENNFIVIMLTKLLGKTVASHMETIITTCYCVFFTLIPATIVVYMSLNNSAMIIARRMQQNLRITTTHNPMEFKISGLSEHPCNQQVNVSLECIDAGKPNHAHYIPIEVLCSPGLLEVGYILDAGRDFPHSRNQDRSLRSIRGH